MNPLRKIAMRMALASVTKAAVEHEAPWYHHVPSLLKRASDPWAVATTVTDDDDQPAGDSPAIGWKTQGGSYQSSASFGAGGATQQPSHGPTSGANPGGGGPMAAPTAEDPGSGLKAASLFKHSISYNLIRKTFMEAPAEKLTAERAAGFEGTLNKWLQGGRDLGPNPLGLSGAVGRSAVETINAYDRVGRVPASSYTPVSQATTTANAGHPLLPHAQAELPQETVGRLHSLFGRGPRPAFVGMNQNPNQSMATTVSMERFGMHDMAPAAVSTPSLGILGHELGHVAATPSTDRLMSAYERGLPSNPMLPAYPGAKSIAAFQSGRATLARERLANAAWKRTAGRSLPEMASTLNVPSYDQDALRGAIQSQMNHYQLGELSGIQSARSMLGRSLTSDEMRYLSKPNRDFIGRLQQYAPPSPSAG